MLVRKKDFCLGTSNDVKYSPLFWKLLNIAKIIPVQYSFEVDIVATYSTVNK